MSKIVDTVIKFGVVTILIVAAATRQEYSYYTFVRWVVMTTSIYFAYKAFHQKMFGLGIYFSALVLLFNPLKPFWFQRDTWHLIDYLVAVITSATIYFDLKHSTPKQKIHERVAK